MIKGKRFAALMLSLIMVLTMMPAMAFAEDEASASEPVAAETAGEAEAVEEEAAADSEEAVMEDEGTEEEAQPVEEEEPVSVEDPQDVSKVEEEAPAETGTAVKSTADDISADAVSSDTADDEEAAEIAEDEISAEGILDDGLSIDSDAELEGADPEEQVEAFINDGAEETVKSGTGSTASNSVKGSRLTGKDLVYYNAFKSVINNVANGKTVNTYKKVKITKITGKRTFTAKELGLSRIGYVKNNKLYLYKAAQTKIDELVSPKDWERIYTSALSDLSNNSYWADWHSSTRLLKYNCPFTFTKTKIVFKSTGTVSCRLPVQPEFRGSLFKVSKTKLENAKIAKTNARNLVKTFDEAIPTTFAGYTNAQIDYYRLWNYCRWIAIRNVYDDYAADANYNSLSYKGPWSWVYVFDGNDSTNAVCEGYARAFKLLCDMSKFKSRWIDCQIVNGFTQSGSAGKHMWNIVRMNDGRNYVVDPTWMDCYDDPDDGYKVDENWFLRGAPSGTANGYTIEGNTRTYDSWTKAAFAKAERKLSTKDRYDFPATKSIILKSTSIKKLYKKKGGFKVTWTKVNTPLRALYIDGYQIQYSKYKTVSKGKKIKVKGFGRTSKVIKNLKRNKKYYVRIRTYANVGGKTYYGKWSKRRWVKTK